MEAVKHFERAGAPLAWRHWAGQEGAPALVMLHGLASNGTRWREFAEATVARTGWHVIAPDLRGHGGSARRGRLHIRHWLEDLEALLDHAGFERAVIGGHCLGANVALHFARAYPRRTQGLVLVEPMLPDALRGPLGVMRRLRWLLTALSVPVRLLNALGIYRRRLPPLDLTELDARTRAAMAEHGSFEAMRKRYSAPRMDMFHMPVASYLQALSQLLRPLGGLDRLRLPVLTLLSSGGVFADTQQTQHMLQSLPEHRMEVFDALHWIPTEQPQAMIDTIGRWLSEQWS